jgi:hypothetical protein
MAFLKKEEKKGLSLPGLIDIIFLLLIFSLVTLSFSGARVDAKKRGARGADLNLPETKFENTFKGEEILQTLLFQVEHTDPEDLTSPKIVYVLWPVREDSITVAQAKENAVRDSTFAAFSPDFLQMDDSDFVQSSPCTLIRSAFRRYKDTYFTEPSYSNSIEIRAVWDTEFRIVNFVIEQCSAYGDTIPRFVLHTLTGREVEGGAED